MRNTLALIELGQPCVNLREEDQTPYRVIHGRVGRQVLQGLKDAIALSWKSHRPILTLTSAPGTSAPRARRLRRPNTGDRLRSGARVRSGRRGHEAACPFRQPCRRELRQLIPLFGGVAASSTCTATHSAEAPIPRKPFQLPSGSLFWTPSTWPRICFTSPPADSTYDTVK